MEKISGIVRGSPRITSADNKNAAPARTGMPSFGRPPGESTAVDMKTTSTASRAVALHNANVEAKKAVSQERIVQQMADKFFMSHPELNTKDMLPMPEQIKLDTASTDDLMKGEIETPSIETPTKEYTPRGSFVDVRA